MPTSHNLVLHWSEIPGAVYQLSGFKPSASRCAWVKIPAWAPIPYQNPLLTIQTYPYILTNKKRITIKQQNIKAVKKEQVQTFIKNWRKYYGRSNCIFNPNMPLVC